MSGDPHATLSVSQVARAIDIGADEVTLNPVETSLPSITARDKDAPARIAGDDVVYDPIVVLITNTSFSVIIRMQSDLTPPDRSGQARPPS